ncbi:glycerol-3-phosphate dehydrogenase [Pleomorphomonas diazotrophica]|uniref:Glycerol-3-phosphate dehydrogenase [NAD(P)+] n=1 Tax=Pleomorphomonas diazotrophica TaxID=1166257 RepID=A0A1I4RWZ3_9HYPH|nr:NAD(P)H-dependent glycerol-3-phosphate dehydrogenase [Pleomorphomonas diazotrophica]PKR87990.1 glycerol-3-phosphate dehydrogenase [Pleomorphomonas diazotrophica]SFM56755.1 glycerol-3-phosphate dehydrogenase (NAD(P)+) [Pleomorphomonas diazotrophica]
MSNTIGVYGAGAWGSALALTAARAGAEVILCGRNAEEAETLNATRCSPHLEDAVFPSAVTAYADPAALAGVDLLLLAVPAQSCRSAAAALAGIVGLETVIVSCAKGIEQATGVPPSVAIAAALPGRPVAVLSGPGFADDVARGLPTAVTVAAREIALADAIARRLAGPSFRPYAATDVAGVELGGALKNVLAIAAGIVAGRALGASAQAAVITRGFVEMRRLAAAFGAEAETLMGLSGFGDLVLTCSSTQSRNFSFGLGIGQGESPASFGKLAEGAATVGIAVQKATEFSVEVPIMAAVADVLAGQLSIDDAVDRLMARPLKRENVI